MLETRKIDLNDLSTSVVAAVQTDPGCVREANEDSGRHINPNDPDLKARRGTLTVVADGMGGHASGEVASQIAVELIAELYYADNDLSAPDALRNAIEIANAEIYAQSLASEDYAGMGTTVVALCVLDGVGFSAHVGDSRLYRLRSGSLEMLTMDHSQVMEMVSHGILTMEQARTHDDKNVILRAVGTQDTVDVEISDEFEALLWDTFLLCSDGLSDMLNDAEIENILLASADQHTACEKLIAAAKANGGHDNITVGVIRIANDNGAIATDKVRITREFQAQV
jgi:serine/threonine protein phosphatase PrpC